MWDILEAYGELLEAEQQLKIAQEAVDDKVETLKLLLNNEVGRETLDRLNSMLEVEKPKQENKEDKPKRTCTKPVNGETIQDRILGFITSHPGTTNKSIRKSLNLGKSTSAHTSNMRKAGKLKRDDKGLLYAADYKEVPRKPNPMESLTEVQILVLGALQGQPNTTAKQVAEHQTLTTTSKPAIQSALDALTLKGLIVKNQNLYSTSKNPY